MEEFASRTSSDPELDSHRLRNILDSLTSEISVPFLERRARSNSLKKNPIEELSYVISELTNRERDMHACVGISRMIIERNEEQMQKLKKCRTKKQYFKNVIREIKNENETLQTDLVAAEEKNQQVNAALIKAEEQLISLLAEHKRMLRENSSKQQEKVEVNDHQIDDEVNDLISRYKEHDLQLQKKNQDLQKLLENTKSELAKSESAASNLKDQNYKLEKDLIKSKEKYKDLEDEFSSLQDEKYNIDSKYKQLTNDYNRVKSKADKLSEDIQVIETANQPSPRKPKVRRHISLMSELEEISRELVPEPSEPAFILSSPRLPSLKLTNPIQVASISTKKQLNKRKNPLEEYFTLITQAVKLNSPYMDAICVIPPNELYEKALQEDIPFHRWHIWVESKLTAAYIDLVYKSSSKKKTIF